MARYLFFNEFVFRHKDQAAMAPTKLPKAHNAIVQLKPTATPMVMAFAIEC